jgi:PAS domain S-box-containing protein
MGNPCGLAPVVLVGQGRNDTALHEDKASSARAVRPHYGSASAWNRCLLCVPPSRRCSLNKCRQPLPCSIVRCVIWLSRVVTFPILALLFSTAIFAPAEVIGRSFHEISPDMPQRWHAIHARALAGEERAQEEELVLRPDGGAVWVRWSMKPWRTVDGRIGGALLFSELITEQVEIRHALADSEARFRATFENAAVGITHVAPDGSFLRFNKALSRLLGWPADELITKSVQEITHPDDRAAELAQFKQLEDGRVDSYSMEKRDLRKDGTIVWIRLTRSCVRKSDGSVDYFRGCG